jgi:HemY protein
VLLIGVFILAALVTVVYRSWSALRRAPGTLGRKFGEGRRRRGYKALSQGMAAVAAGDPDEARRLARKAESLLAMLEREETRFMGLRGCLMQALREGDKEAALDYVRRAHAIRPKTPWVLTAMVELSEATGNLIAAERAIRDATRHKALTPAEGQRKRAVVLLQKAMAARAESKPAEALKQAREAHKLDAGLVPATVLLGEQLVVAGRGREAARMLEKAWPAQPHPDLPGQADPAQARSPGEPFGPGRGRPRGQALGRGTAPPGQGGRQRARARALRTGLPPHGPSGGIGTRR